MYLYVHSIAWISKTLEIVLNGVNINHFPEIWNHFPEM